MSVPWLRALLSKTRYAQASYLVEAHLVSETRYASSRGPGRLCKQRTLSRCFLESSALCFMRSCSFWNCTQRERKEITREGLVRDVSTRVVGRDDAGETDKDLTGIASLKPSGKDKLVQSARIYEVSAKTMKYRRQRCMEQAVILDPAPPLCLPLSSTCGSF